MDSAKNQIDTWDFSNDTITITGDPENASNNIILNSPSSTFEYSTLSPGFIAQDISTMAQGVGTITGGYTYDHTNWAIPAKLEQSGQLSLQGENADIVINGVSLVDKLDAIAERLNILDVNPALEEEWDQLRELGERYRQLEEDLKAKSEMWKTLKTKTPNKPRS